MRLHIPAYETAAFSITTSALEPVPVAHTEAWIRSRLAADGFESSELRALTTTCGWPAIVAYGQLAGVPTLRVYFQFLDLGALAEARATDPAALLTAWDVLATARPDYSGELAALGHLFA